MEFNGSSYNRSDARNVVQAIHDVCAETGHKLQRVYGIHQRTFDSAWFKKALTAGYWKSLGDLMSELIEKLDETTLKRVKSYQEFNDEKRIGTVPAKKLLEQLDDKSSPFRQHCQMIVNLIPSLGLYDALRYFTNKCGNTKFVCSEMNTSCKEMAKRYPMIFRHMKNYAIKNCDFGEKYYTLGGVELTEIVDYINIVDLHLTK
jgi:hypothetical protein